jgi:hypothetical protein
VSSSSSWRKVWVEVRRRGWVVLLSVAGVVVVALAVASVLSTSSRAESVLVVRAAGPLAEQPNSSTKLAATYATLIPLDTKIQVAAEEALAGSSGWSFSTTNDPNTALLRLTFEAEDAEEAIEGAKIVSRAVSGPEPVSGNIEPGTIAVVRLPTSAEESSAETQLLAVAVVLGLLLGIVLLSYWRPRDARVDTLSDLRSLLTCRCFQVSLVTAEGLRSLFDALVDRSGRGSTAVVPCRPRDVRTAESLAKVLTNAFGLESFTLTAVPGSTEAGELAAAEAKTTILVVSAGARRQAVVDAVDVLERYGAAPAYAIIVGDHGRAPGPPIARAEESSDLSLG